MTNKNIPWNGKGRREPFLLKPALKHYLWGGRRLQDEFSKENSRLPLAETWECSTHPSGPSIVASGVFYGLTLEKVIHSHPEFLGVHVCASGELPILLKLIDAKQDLSIQVHPNDAYASAHENGQRGKSEMWYVLDAQPGAELIYGLCHDMSRASLRRSLQEGTIEKFVQRIPVQKGDVFYVEAGTVHAIGAGILIAEIQENSDLTYRLYDYHRTGRDGKERELHIEKALDVANLCHQHEPHQAPRALCYRQGYAIELLCRCKSFKVHRMLLNTERCRELVWYRTGRLSFQVLLCIKGCGTLKMEGGEDLPFFKGDSIFFPADSVEAHLHGQAQFLTVQC